MTASARLGDEARRDIQGVISSGYGHLPSAAYLFLSITNIGGADIKILG